MSLYLGENLISGQATLVGESRNIGQIIPSAIPLTDAGLHLLDGTLLPYGVYKEFIDYIADLYAENPSANYFTTEAQWQQSVTTYGVCGKFVYNATNNTVRLPKVSDILQGTTDVTALGDLVEAGLPNITGAFVPSDGVDSTSTGCVYDTKSSGYGEGRGTAGQWFGYHTYYIDASRSSSLYKNNFNKVQPQTIKAFYYIVIATSTKTDIQVDIDEIATDLNGKADTNLSNVPTSKGILSESYVNGTSWYRIYADGWCEQGGRKSASADGDYSVTFLQSYTDTNYTLAQWSGLKSTYSSQYNNGVSVKSLSTTGFTYNSYDYNNTLFWQASGYIR